jgi:hypothetical protein
MIFRSTEDVTKKGGRNVGERRQLDVQFLPAPRATDVNGTVLVVDGGVLAT